MPHEQRGADISFLSAFPAEKEFLFPPLTFLHPVKDAPEVRPSLSGTPSQHGMHPNPAGPRKAHARPFVGVFQKSMFKRSYQLLAINAH